MTLTQEYGKWYGDGNLNEFHADLRTNYPDTARRTHDRPWLSKHFDTCDVCATIREDHMGAIDAQRQITEATGLARRRVETIIDLDEMSEIIGLSGDQEIVHMYCTPDGSEVHVVVIGSEFPEVAPGQPVPVIDATVPPGEVSNVVPLRDAA